MVAECKTNSQLLKRVAEIYKWLDSQIRQTATWLVYAVPAANVVISVNSTTDYLLLRRN